MFENYIHTQEDLDAIEEALNYLEKPELDFIFENRKLIGNVEIISFDSKELFIWTRSEVSNLEKLPCKVEGWNAYRISHNTAVTDEDQRGWSGGIKKEEFKEILTPHFKGKEKSSFISGPLLTPFTKFHKARRTTSNSLDPYYTKESYLATIVHELGHVYYNNHKLWYYGSKDENLNYLTIALKAYENNVDLSNQKVRFPMDRQSLSEVFAFCTDYTTASIFWPNYKEDVDAAAASNIKKMSAQETNLNLEKEDSTLNDRHNFAMVMGKILLEKYPNNWPEVFLNFANI